MPLLTSMVEWRTATPISLGAALFFGLLVVDIYGGSVNGLQTSYERFLSHTSSERRMLLSKQVTCLTLTSLLTVCSAFC